MSTRYIIPGRLLESFSIAGTFSLKNRKITGINLNHLNIFIAEQENYWNYFQSPGHFHWKTGKLLKLFSITGVFSLKIRKITEIILNHWGIFIEKQESCWNHSQSPDHSHWNQLKLLTLLWFYCNFITVLHTLSVFNEQNSNYSDSIISAGYTLHQSYIMLFECAGY